MFDFIVIGKGLIGSAALRYLSEVTRSAAVIGPDEPPDVNSHHGLYASHYDEGRGVGRLGQDLTWALLTSQAIEQYSSIEARSGIPFYSPTGRLIVLRGDTLSHFLKRYESVSKTLGVQHDVLTESELCQRFPMFAFPRGSSAVFERPPAGLLRPRALIRGQLAISANNGTTIITEEVHHLRQNADSITVVTHGGRQFCSARVLLAGGAFSNCHNLLPRKLALSIKTETVILAEVAALTRPRLADMPTLSYQIASPTLSGMYLTPPLKYPDGRFYIKVGCNTATDEYLCDLPAMQRWMTEGRNDGMPAAMLDALLAFMPALDVGSWRARPCLEAYTPHGKPFIDQLSDRIFIATGGNGMSAQCSDTLGQLAARLLLNNPWPAHFQRSDFRALHEGDMTTTSPVLCC
jgi:sarcosine oxidase